MSPGFFFQDIRRDSPKFGTMQRKLSSSTVDLVGRAVITPNSDLDMDEVALPEDKAWEIYKPFVVRGLVALRPAPDAGVTVGRKPRQISLCRAELPTERPADCD
jgi:DNA-directed RNA polymerase beta' subunit